MDEGVDEELHVEITTNMRQDNDIKTMHPDMEINEFISSQSRECGQEEFMFWCQRCEVMRSALCRLHGKPKICPDTPRLTLAEASLPNGLYINRTHRGIFCSKAFTVNTVFGPFVAPPVDSQDDISDKDKILPFGLNEGCVRYLNPLEENVCNWMMFVRPAQLWSEINVMLYEVDKKLYFVTTKTLQSKGSELKYGYTSQYADCYGLQVLKKDSQFACEPCGMTFLSKMNMMRHCKSSKCIAEKLTLRNTTVKEEPYIGENRKDSESTVPATQSPQEDIIVRVKSRSFTANPAIRLLKGKRLKSSRRMQCHVCKLGFDSKQLMGIHMLRHRTREDSLDENEMFSPHCPQCDEEFLEAAELFDHIDTQHSKRVGKPASRLSSDELTDDMMTGGDNLILSDNRLVMTDHTEIQADHQYDRTGSTMTCEICSKQVTTASQLAVHMKTHDNDGDKFYKCFMCHEAFSSCKSVGEHVKVHAIDGKYYCPQCPNKVFEDWKKCRKHIKVIHSGREFPCVHCDRVFSRPDKLRLHSLTHTNVRNHMCDICGRQFARRDKLQEHIKKIHDDREDGDAAGVPLYQTGGSKFKPRVPASEYHRFIYKCLDCSLGFKRRGMLVNHLAKCHPSVAMSSIPELNLPILRTQREFYCQHCNRSYKSSTKRKMHMLKCHPGCSIPTNNISQPVGNVTTFPFACEYCHKQYASKAKLTEHKKMKHMDYLTGEKLPPPSMIQSLNDNRMNEQSTSAADIANQDVVTLIQPLDPNTGEPVTISLQGINLTSDGSRVDASDLLTQAMSVNELQGLQASFDFQQQQQLGGAGSQHQIITSGGLEFRVIPNSNVSIDLNSLQMAGLSNNGSITFTVPTSSMGQVHPIQNQIITTTNNIPNLNSTAMPNTTSPKDWSYPVKLL